MTSQRGGFVMGLVAGLLIGLALALGVALYITKAPVPFLNKVPQRTAEQDTAETERNRNWDPNAPLAGKVAARAAAAASGAASAAGGASGVRAESAAEAASATKPSVRDPVGGLAGRAPATAAPTAAPTQPGVAAADPFIYFVQAGAFTRNEDAEQQRARLALMGQVAKITEREQAGRTVFRVRLGPLATRDEADTLQVRLQEQSIETQIVRVERP